MMANNPNPTHITGEMWWFIEQLDLLDGPDTVYAGSWGDFKPGYHCDAFNLWWHKDKSGAYIWRNDYSTRLSDDKVLGSPLEHFGAAVDLTFRSAQAGNPAVIRKYGSRVRSAWLARDPRLKGWREVLIQGDADASADGFDFVTWTERTPDSTHTWHGHFSILRKYVATRSAYEAMLSILKGETLAQWLATKGDDMAAVKIFQFPAGAYWLAKGDGVREPVLDEDDMKKAVALYPGAQYPGVDDGKVFPAPPLEKLGWTEDEVDRLIGRRYVAPSSGGGLSESEVRAIAAETVAGSHVVPPA